VNDAGVQNGVIRKHGDADINDNWRLLVQLCCNSALRTMSTFPNTYICTSTPRADVGWVNGHSLISAWFWLTCSNQCSTFRSKWMQNFRQITNWWSATCTLKNQHGLHNCAGLRGPTEVGEALVDMHVRKTFADS